MNKTEKFPALQAVKKRLEFSIETKPAGQAELKELNHLLACHEALEGLVSMVESLPQASWCQTVLKQAKAALEAE
jgi:hypothetical protein